MKQLPLAIQLIQFLLLQLSKLWITLQCDDLSADEADGSIAEDEESLITSTPRQTVKRQTSSSSSGVDLSWIPPNHLQRPRAAPPFDKNRKSKKKKCKMKEIPRRPDNDKLQKQQQQQQQQQHSPIDEGLKQSHNATRHYAFKEENAKSSNPNVTQLKQKVDAICREYKGNIVILCPLCLSKKKFARKKRTKCEHGHKWDEGIVAFYTGDDYSQVEQAKNIPKSTHKNLDAALKTFWEWCLSCGLLKREIAVEVNAFIQKTNDEKNKTKTKTVDKVVTAYSASETSISSSIIDLDTAREICTDEGVGESSLTADDVQDAVLGYYDLSMQGKVEEALKKPERFVLCTIHLHGTRAATCKPIGGQEDIQINARMNCGPTFDGDEVLVEVMEKTTNKLTNEITRKGRVVAVVRCNSKRKGTSYLCKVDEHDSRLMRPLCGTLPKLRMDDTPMRNVSDKYRASNVVIQAMVEGKLKKVRDENVSSHSRESRLYVVTFLKWETRCMYPLGYVRGIVKLPQDLSITERIKLIDILYKVPFREMEDCDLSVEHNDLGRGRLIDNVFSIDPEDCENIDDAISIEGVVGQTGHFRVGIHIVDVAAFVKKDHSVDCQARRRGVTYYPGESLPHPMLPKRLSIDMLSLKQGQVRSALSVFLEIDKDGKIHGDPSIEETLIKNARTMTYKEAQPILNGDGSQEDQHPFKKELQNLHEITQVLRKRRLGKGSYHVDFKNGSPEPDREAHQLIEELMILANKSVGSLLSDAMSVEVFPARGQQPPNENQVDSWTQQLPSAVGPHSLYFDQFKDNGLEHNWQGMINILKQIPILKTTAERALCAINEGDFKEAARLLAAEKLHPLHLAALEHWYAIQSQAQFECVNRSKMKTVLHHQLNAENYVQFTSPLRRFNDVVIHRIVKSVLHNESMPYMEEELVAICNEMNDKTQNQRQYGADCDLQQRLAETEKSPTFVSAVVDSIEDGSFTVSVAGEKRRKKDKRIVKYSHLNVSEAPRVENYNKVTLNWKMRLYDALGFSAEPRTNASTHQSTDFSCNSLTISFSTSEWDDLMTTIQTSPSSLKSSVLSDKLDEIKYSRSSEATSEMKDNELLCHQHCYGTISLNVGDVLPIQISAESKLGLLHPTINLIQLEPNLHLCLKHHKDPVDCFTKKATVPTIETYCNIQHYKNVLNPIMAMEAVTATMAEAGMICVKHCPVKLEKSGEKCTGCFRLTMNFCKMRNLPFVEDKIAVAYLCLKYRTEERERSVLQPTRHNVWVAHAVVTEADSIEVENGNKIIEASFRIHHQSSEFPDEDLHKEIECSVELFFKPLTIRFLDEAVANLHKASPLVQNLALGRQLEDNVIDYTQNIKNYDIPNMMKNNDRQTEAIRTAMSCTFAMIQGPPGTGKTSTGANLAYWFAQKNKRVSREINCKELVLYCGPSNACVDVAATSMKTKLSKKCPSLVRIYNTEIVNAVYPVPRESTCSAARMSTARVDRNQELDDIALHHLVRKPTNSHSSKLRTYDQKFRENMNTPENVPDKDIEDYNNELGKAYKEELMSDRAEVVLCTCAISGSGLFKFKPTENIVIKQCIVDECGMCTEAETLIPLVATKPSQIVLIGDHKQLQPIVLNPDAKKLGLDVSLFERYSRNVVRLTHQYRMHPAICQFPSDHFYDGELVTKGDVWKQTLFSVWPRSKQPIAFCNVEGNEISLSVSTSDGNENSKKNEKEIEHVVIHSPLQHQIIPSVLLTASWGLLYHIDYEINLFVYCCFGLQVRIYERFARESKSVAVLTQYRAQCAEIKRRLETKHPNSEPIVKTVVKSQGGEWDYVILSTVRSMPLWDIEKHPSIGWLKQNLGFIMDPHQINVALTRARKGLVILGNQHLLRCDEMWKKLLLHYKNCGALVDVADFPRKQH